MESDTPRLTRDDELWADLAGARLTLDCVCGFKTSHISYLRDHYYSGNCHPMPKELLAYRTIAAKITERLRLIYETKTLLEADFAYLSAIIALDAKPIKRTMSPTELRIEAKHDRNALRAAKGDTAVASILKDLIYGA